MTEALANQPACPACGDPIAASARYCSRCGIRISDAPAAAPSQNPSVPAPGPDGDYAPHLADPLIGVIVAERYRILELIGRGGMGVVYRVEHTRIGKLMALKLLSGELSRDRGILARFNREALMVSKLSHPNTVQVFDYGTSEGLTYLAMEYLPGKDLGALIRRHKHLPVSRTAAMVVQVCNSLGEAHGKGIVHRDLKPENILLVPTDGEEDFVKVLDFGLAKLRESHELGEVSTHGAVIGTPFFMSPEQIRGEAVDERSDIYSLGAVMFTCVTGRPPFDAATPMGVLTKHLVEPVVSPSQRYPELAIPRAFSDIVLKALAKDRLARFQSIQDLQRAVLDFVAEQGVSPEALLDADKKRRLATTKAEAATRDEVEKYERKLRRRGRFVWAISLSALAAAVAVGIRFWPKHLQDDGVRGLELEPNNSASEANPLVFGSEVRGQIGRRLDRQRSDRDFFKVEVPAGVGPVELTLEPLPNMALCAALYRTGLASPLGQYCSGAPEKKLVVDSLAIDPGSYLIAVMQDNTHYDPSSNTPVHENVSDIYRLRLDKAHQGGAGLELEPNDSAEDANILHPGDELGARLSWVLDQDVFCTVPTSQGVRFVVEESAAPRPLQATLEVTPRGTGLDGIPVRVHHPNEKMKKTPTDRVSPWQSPTVKGTNPEERACVEVRLTPNPLAPTPHPLVAPASRDVYTVRVEMVTSDAAATTTGRHDRHH
ncbi:MAG TPA: serine/threonine-protein kinase [Polyangiaceae bacterium]|nr:serine/threonine-protein kinase [Polyangiaceae bacterium]